MKIILKIKKKKNNINKATHDSNRTWVLIQEDEMHLLKLREKCKLNKTIKENEKNRKTKGNNNPQ